MTTGHIRTWLAGFLFWTVGVYSSAFAGGERTNVRGMGMARTFVATSRGIEASGINPANLALPGTGTVAVSVLPFGFHVGSEFLDYDLYTSYFTGVETDTGRVARYLSESDKQRILASFAGDVAGSMINFDALLLGASLRIEKLGGFAFTITDQLGASADVPKDYLEFILNGNTPGSIYDFTGAALTAAWVREYSLSFGSALPKASFLEWLAGGIGVKLVHGFAYYEVERFDATLSTATDGTLTGTVDFLARRAGGDPFATRSIRNYELLANPAGVGVGLDLGVSGAFNDFLSFGLSVTDMGSVRWKTGAEQTFAETTLVVDDPLRGDQRDAIENALKGKKRLAAPFTTSLPTMLRFGLALEVHKLNKGEGFPGELLLALDYNQGLRVTPGLTRDPRVSLGIEYKPIPWLPLRTGASFGGTDELNLALGFGIELSAFTFALSSENVTWLFIPNSFSYGSFAVGTQLRF